MDLNAVLLNYGAVLEAGHSEFTWNSDGTLALKELYADATNAVLMYTKSFTWNIDGTLSQWVLTVVATGEMITKSFVWNPDGTLSNATTVAS